MISHFDLFSISILLFSPSINRTRTLCGRCVFVGHDGGKIGYYSCDAYAYAYPYPRMFCGSLTM
jgi:hypothetical protein